MFCMGVYFFPVNIYAAEVEPPTIQATVSGDALRIEVEIGSFEVEAVFINENRFNYRVNNVLLVDLLFYENENIITVYAVDFEGNRSNIVTVTNPHYVPPFTPQSIPLTQPSNPFTPDGQATVLDIASDGDNKDFFTFRTPDGNVFFLIVDHERNGDNVYFLNAVTENDLMSLAAGQSGNQVNNMGGIPVTTIPLTQEAPETTAEALPTEETAPPPVKNNNNGTMIFIFLAVAAIGIGGYYVKIIRPKQQGQYDDDYANEDTNEDLGDEMVFETEDDSDNIGDEIIIEDDNYEGK